MCVCYFTINMCNISYVHLYLRLRLFLHIGKYELKLTPTIPMHCHRVFLFSVGRFLILFSSTERPAFHRPGPLTYWTNPYSWQVTVPVPVRMLSSPPSHPAGVSTLSARPPETPDTGRCLVLFHLVASGLSFSGKGRSDRRKSYLHFHLSPRIIL